MNGSHLPLPLLKPRGAARYIRSDNGAEFISRCMRNCLDSIGVETSDIEPVAEWLHREFQQPGPGQIPGM